MTQSKASTGSWLDNLHYLTASETGLMPWLWGAFFRNPQPELVEQVSQWFVGRDFGHGPFNDLAHQLPQDWPKGNSERYGRVTHGHFQASALAIFCTSGARALRAVNPFLQRLDVHHALTIKRVRIWPDRLQAEVECTCGELELAFYDAGWMLHFYRYSAGRTMGFSLVGLANSARKVVSESFVLTEPPWLDAVLNNSKDFAHDVNEQGQRTVTFHTQGMGSFIAHETERCQYAFRGAVKALSALPDLFGQPSWLAVVTVGRDIQHPGGGVDDFDLDIVVTRLVWGEGPAPLVGDDMEGSVWLQGCVTGL